MRKTTHALAVPVALLLAAGITACGSEVPVSPTDESTTAAQPEETTEESPLTDATKPAEQPSTPAEVESETASVMNLQVGDCFSYDDSENGVAEVEMISCNDPHLFEVYNNYDIDDSVYTTVPVGDDLDNEIYNACYDSFEMYVGIPLDNSIYDVQTLQPSSGSWAQGDRTINCLITSADGTDLTGSARDTAK